MLKRLFISVIVLSCLAFTCKAAGSTKLRFSRISIEDGLSQNTVLSIVQDRDGFIWFATHDGLNKYDGYDFTVFRHSKKDTASISDNRVNGLFIDSSDRLWACTAKGLSRYDRSLEKFHNFGSSSGLAVYCMEEVSGDTLLVGTEKGLQFFDAAAGTFLTDMPEAMSRMTVITLKRDGGKIYIGSSSDGLFEYIIEEKEFRKIGMFRSGSPVQSILPQQNGQLWVCTEGDGLFLLDIEQQTLRNYRNTGAKGDIGSNYVRSIATDEDGRIWVGTFNNLGIYDPLTETFSIYTNDAFDDESLSQNSVRSIFRDNQGGMWLGTFYGGVNYWHRLKERFGKIQRKLDGSTLNDNIISCIVEDSDGTMWIGTNNGGVNKYNPGTEEFTWYTLLGMTDLDDVESNDIKSIFIDGRSVYVGAHAGGMKLLDKRDGKILSCGKSSSGTLPTDVYSIVRRNDEQMWIGSLQGLYSYDKITDSYTEILTDISGSLIPQTKIMTLMTDSKGRLWVGGEERLQIFRVEEGQLSPYSPPDSGILQLSGILCFLESNSGMVWTGTRSGLYCYEPQNGSLKHYTTEDGLQSDIIRGIEEDSLGRIWISTANGLSCLNPYSEGFRNYTVADGLPSNQFNTYSHCRRKSGEMYFGSINGIAVFTPELLTDNPYTLSPAISGLKIFNTSVTPGDDSGILDRSIVETESIRLRHSQNSFTIFFTVADYISGGHNTFAYMLEGIDDGWQYSHSSRYASYARIPKGKYRFLVKVANNDGKWCDSPAVLDIKVLPVWYNTLFAHIFFLIIIFLLIGGGIWFYLYRKSVEAKLEMDRKDREHQEEIYQMKTRFFISISHELRTPLTLIIAPLQEMIARAYDIWMRKQLKYVYRNSQRLLHLVNQLMDYRRAELGVFKLKVRKEKVGRIVRENWAWYEKLAQSKKLKYTCECELGDDETAYADGQYLELILNNLISNAFKYTDSGSIEVSAKISDEKLVLEVKDTGTGITAGEQDKIFEHFYQLNSKHIGSGIGLSLVHRLVELHHGKLELESEEGKGSTFRILIPQSLDVYSAEELDLEGTGRQEVHTTNSKEMFMIDSGQDNAAGDLAEPAGNDWNVLIVDDDDDIRDYIRNSLSPMFNTFTAQDGQAAIEVMGKHRIDLVVTDMMMPVLDGIKLCARIKHNPDTRHIPVIMLSASYEGKAELEALKSGADDYISKPFSMSVLTAKIRNRLMTKAGSHPEEQGKTVLSTGKISYNAADSAFLKKATDVVKAHLDNSEFSTDEFAREMLLSRSGLHYKIKSLTGESALDFIRSIRFQEACRLLMEGSLTISQIADRTGFGSASYFSSTFKKHFGCLPSEYAKLHKN